MQQSSIHTKFQKLYDAKYLFYLLLSFIVENGDINFSGLPITIPVNPRLPKVFLLTRLPQVITNNYWKV